MHQVTETRRVTKKKPKPKEKVPKENPNEYPYIGQAFKAMYRGQIDRNASPEKIEQFYEEAITRLRWVVNLKKKHAISLNFYNKYSFFSIF